MIFMKLSTENKIKDTEINQNELYFEWFLNELKGSGYIDNYYREPESFIVSDKILYGEIQRFKTKESSVIYKTLFSEITTTYDYIIIWNNDAMYYFFEVMNDKMLFSFKRPPFIAHKREIENEEKYVSYVDVKPASNAQKGGKVSSSNTFTYKQILCFIRNGIYINKIVPIPSGKNGMKISLFVNTFTPMRYLFTDGSGVNGRNQLRKFQWKEKSITLKDYIKNKTEYLLKQKSLI